MREMLSSKSFKKLICLLIAIFLVMGISAVSDKSIVSSFVNSVTFGLQQVSASVSKEAGEKSYDELLSENQALSSQVADLRTQLVDYYETKEENERLWKYYDLQKDYPDFELLPSMVLRRDPSDDYYSFTVNKGSNQGVSVGDPVVTQMGLVGVVDKVDSNTAHVKTILSPDVKAGAINTLTRDTGIIRGNAKYCDQGLTTITKLSQQNTMKAGDILITTGTSGVYPPSVIIGEVQEIFYDDYDTSLYAVVKPFEDIKNLTDVVIITHFDGQGELSELPLEDVMLPGERATAPSENPTETETNPTETETAEG